MKNRNTKHTEMSEFFKSIIDIATKPQFIRQAIASTKNFMNRGTMWDSLKLSDTIKIKKIEQSEKGDIKKE